MKWKYLALTALVLTLAGFTAKRYLVSETTRIRKRLDDLATCVSKSPGEAKLTSEIVKLQRLQGMFANPCTFQVTSYRLAAKLSPTEIAQETMRAKTMASEVKLTFHDLAITITENDTATAEFTARVKVVTDGPAYETAVVHCRLRKENGTWLFATSREVPVFEK